MKKLIFVIIAISLASPIMADQTWKRTNSGGYVVTDGNSRTRIKQTNSGGYTIKNDKTGRVTGRYKKTHSGWNLKGNTSYAPYLIK